MADSSSRLHEPTESLSRETRELHRALASLMEELEAVDWYAQRIDATSDDELRRILEHNRDEEKEHACMTLEWIRRHDARFDQFLRRYLFLEGSPVEADSEADTSDGGDGSLGLGRLGQGGER